MDLQIRKIIISILINEEIGSRCLFFEKRRESERFSEKRFVLFAIFAKLSIDLQTGIARAVQNIIIRNRRDSLSRRIMPSMSTYFPSYTIMHRLNGRLCHIRLSRVSLN